MNDPMNNNQITTDADMEAQFNERNKNLKQGLNQIVDKIDTAANKTQDYLSSNEQSTMSAGANSNSGGFSTGDLSNITGRSTSSVIGEQSSLLESDWGNNRFDRKLMSSVEADIVAMHSTDPEIFETVASKMEDTFAQNALV